MTRDELIRVAREAGGVTAGHDTMLPDLNRIERFAALVAQRTIERAIDLVAMYGGPVDLEAAIRAIDTSPGCVDSQQRDRQEGEA